MESKTLLQPIKLGDILLNNKIVMSPMGRARTEEPLCIPGNLNVEYYSQRASAGLIITECCWFHPKGHKGLGVPGMCNEDQAKGWRKVTDAVHEKGGKIFCQLYHDARSGIPNIKELQRDKKSLTPSDTTTVEEKSEIGLKRTDEYPPEKLMKDDINELLEALDKAGKFAVEAGFDGVELHAATGFLFDDFLKDGINRRTDEYGGGIENRSRLVLEGVDKLVKTWGPGRVGIKFSPVSRYLDVYDSNPKPLFHYLAKEISQRNLAYICWMEYDGFPSEKWGKGSDQIPNCAKEFRSSTKVNLMTNGGLDFAEGERRIKEGEADLVCFGTKYISNPDLVERYKNDWALTPPDRSTFFTPGPKGYTDYPFYKSS